MKNFGKIFSLCFFAATLFFLQACGDEEISIPTASTQANFTVERGDFYYDAETNNMIYDVTFINNSVRGAKYLWDFGDGTTFEGEDPGTYQYVGSGLYHIALTVTPLEETKDLHYNNLTASARVSLVPTIYMEDFSGITDEDDLPENWLNIDLNGDGNKWFFSSREEDDGMKYYALSESWDGDNVVYPDNLLITETINLSEIESNIALQWEVRPTASTPHYKLEFYSVYITTRTDMEEDDIDVDFLDSDDVSLIFEERLTQDMDNWEWALRDVDVTDFKGQKIRVIFRHHDSSDFDAIAITGIHLFQSGV